MAVRHLLKLKHFVTDPQRDGRPEKLLNAMMEVMRPIARGRSQDYDEKRKMSGMLLDLIVHADWGTNPTKRVVAVGRLLPNGSYSIGPAEQVAQAGVQRERLGIPSGYRGKLLLGFDFPIGVPVAYARQAGITTTSRSGARNTVFRDE
jgi:hypothetical protein